MSDRVFKVTLWTGTNRQKASRRRVIWSGRVEAMNANLAHQKAKAIYRLSRERLGLPDHWAIAEAVGKITVTEVH